MSSPATTTPTAQFDLQLVADGAWLVLAMAAKHKSVAEFMRYVVVLETAVAAAAATELEWAVGDV